MKKHEKFKENLFPEEVGVHGGGGLDSQPGFLKS